MHTEDRLIFKSRTYKVDESRHLDLSYNASRHIIREVRAVSNAEGVGPLDNDLTRLAGIQLSHAFHLSDNGN